MESRSKSIEFTVDTKTYPLEAIYGAAYVFIDKLYIFLSSVSKNEVKVFLKAKDGAEVGNLEDFKGEFFNELLNYSLRMKVSSENKKVRDFIVGQALVSAAGYSGEDVLGQEEEDQDEGFSYEEDPLGIAVPWEEKYGPESSGDDKEQTQDNDKG